jgi:hypothetical protein
MTMNPNQMMMAKAMVSQEALRQEAARSRGARRSAARKSATREDRSTPKHDGFFGFFGLALPGRR